MFGSLVALRTAMEAADAAARADRKETGTTVSVKLVEQQVERLLMITEALWNMVKEQHGYTDEDLMERVRAIDMQDGKIDGKVAPSAARTCPACKRPVSSRHFLCIYCGRPLSGDLFAR